jgi:signal transduction histidine kinase
LAPCSRCDAEQQVLNTHVQDINGLIDTALALSAGRHHAQVALAPLWTRLQTHYPDVVFQIEDAALLERAVSPLLARIVQNLIDNALAHGQGLVRVCLLLKYKEISLSV